MKPSNRRIPYFAYRSFRREFGAMRDFAQLGVDEFVVFAGNTANSLGEPYAEYETNWKFDRTYHFEAIDRQVEELLAAVPQAKILFMIDLNTPLWLARKLNCDSFSELCRVIAEPQWRTLTADYMLAVARHANAKWGERIECFIPMCGQTDEWMNRDGGIETLNKFRAYREWCRAGGLPEPDAAPGGERRYAGSRDGGALRDPVLDRDAVNYWRFHSEMVASAILDFAEKLRGELRPGQEIGVFYGYILELRANRLVQCGHLAGEKLASSPLIDFLISPGDYDDRAMGGGSGFMTPNGTLKTHGRGCLYEIDHRTHTANMRLTPYVELAWMNAWRDTAEDVAGLRREYCRAFMHGAHLWWFDMWGGFFPEREQLEAIGAMRAIHAKYGDRDRRPEAEIAMIVDPGSTLLVNDSPETGGKWFLTHRRVHDMLNRLGAPFEVYSMDDVPRLPERIRVAVFSMAIAITPEQRAMLERSLFPRARCLWIGPTALTDGETWGGVPELPGEFLPFAPSGVPAALDPAPVIAAGRAAGVHFYVDEKLPVWASADGFVSVHTAAAGRRTVRLPRPVRRVVELFRDRVVAEGEGIRAFEYDFAGPDTALFHCEP